MIPERLKSLQVVNRLDVRVSRTKIREEMFALIFVFDYSECKSVEVVNMTQRGRDCVTQPGATLRTIMFQFRHFLAG